MHKYSVNKGHIILRYKDINKYRQKSAMNKNLIIAINKGIGYETYSVVA